MKIEERAAGCDLLCRDQRHLGGKASVTVCCSKALALPTTISLPVSLQSKFHQTNYNTSTITMDRDSLVYRAKLAEQAERFDEMVRSDVQ